MAFSLLNWATNKDGCEKHPSDLVTETNKIAALLQQVIDERITLSIELAGVEQTFSSTIFEVDKKNRVFSIDELMPRAGHDLLITKKIIKATGQGHGPSLSFTAKLIKAGTSSSATYYKLQFPKAVKYTERRGMFRAKVGSATRIVVSCTYSGKELEGYIYDVSGMGMAIILNYAGVIEPEDSVESCRLTLPNGAAMNFDMEIRHCRKIDAIRTLVGGQFDKLDSEQRKLIGKFVRTLERDSLSKRR